MSWWWMLLADWMDLRKVGWNATKVKFGSLYSSPSGQSPQLKPRLLSITKYFGPMD